MIDRRLIFEIHRMADEGLSGPKIARALMLDRTTVARYLAGPNPAKLVVIRTSKLDPFKDLIQSLIERDHDEPATVICQRLQWGHFGSLAYGNTSRKLYCLAVIECYPPLPARLF